MKNFFFLLIITCCLVLTGCNNVFYTEPQPKGVEALAAFPAEFLGVFINGDPECEEGEVKPTVLFIESDHLTSYEYQKVKIKSDSLNASGRFEIRDTLIYDLNLSPGQGLPYKEKEGEISFGYYTQTDYGLSDTLVFKAFKGNYFLNNKEKGKDEWTSLLIERLRDGSQVWWLNDMEKEIDLLSKYTGLKPEDKRDDGSYLINPTKGQLNQLVKAGGFQQRAFLFLRVEDKMEVAELPGVLIRN